MLPAPPAPAPSAPAWFGRLNAGLVLLGALVLAVPLGALAALSGEFALILGILIAVAAAIVLNQRIGVWWLCLMFPMSQMTVMPRQMLGITGFSAVNMLMLATLAAVAAAWFLSRLRGLPLNPPPLPRQLLMLYIAPISLAALHGLPSVGLIPEHYYVTGTISFDSPAGYLRDALIRPMFIVLFALLVAMAYRDSPRPQIFLVAALLQALVIAALVFYVVIASGASLALLATPQGRGVLSPLGMHANELGLLLNSALALVLFAIPAVTGLRRWVLCGLALFLLAAVLATFSRGGFLGLMVVFLAFLIHLRDWRWVLAALVAAALVLLLAPGAVFERALYGVADNDRSAITAGRIDMVWPLLWPVVLDHLAIGSGLMSILWSEPARAGWLDVAHPHNAYLGLLLDKGVIGFIWVMAFFVWAIHNALAASRQAAAAGDLLHRQVFLGAVVTIVLLFVQGVADDRFTPTMPQSFMWLAIGAAIGYRVRRASVAPAPTAAPVPVPDAPSSRLRRGFIAARRNSAIVAPGG